MKHRIKQLLYINMAPIRLLLIYYVLVMAGLGIFIVAKTFTITSTEYDYNTDYTNFMTGAKIAKLGQLDDLYNADIQREIQESIVTTTYLRGFRSLPFVAVAMSPLAGGAFISSLKLFVLISLGLLSLTVLLFAIGAKDYFVKLMLVISFYPLVPSVFNGQVTMVMASTNAVGLYFLRKGYNLFSGLFFALILIKPQFALILPFILLLSSNKVRFLIGFIVGSFLLLSVGLKEIGIYYLFDYLEFVLATENLEFGTYFPSLSSLQSFFYLFTQEHTFLVTKIFILITYPYLLYIYFRKHASLENDLQILIAYLCTLALSLHTFVYDYMLLIFPMFLIWDAKKYKLFWVLHVLPLGVYTGMPFIAPFVFLFVFLYLLEYGYAKFKITGFVFTSNRPKISKASK